MQSMKGYDYEGVKKTVWGLYPYRLRDVWRSEGMQVLATYMELVWRALESGRGVAFSSGGKGAGVAEIASAIRVDRRRLERELNALVSAGLVRFNASAGEVTIPALVAGESPYNPPFAPAPSATPSQTLSSHRPASPSPRYNEEQLEALRNSRTVTEQEYRVYFAGMRARGQRDATKENEDEFWQYLIAADFKKTGGDPITKLNLPSSFIAWVRMRKHEAYEAEEKRKAAEAEKSATAEKAETDRQAYEDWNNRMLKWDGNDDDI